MIQRCFLIPILLSLLLCSFPTKEAEAQGSEQEVFLQFRHQGVVNVYISALYDNDRFYFSVSDIFSPLAIDYSIDTGQFTITGNYLGKGPYRIQLDSTQIATFLGEQLNLDADDFIISELGYYLSPEVFYELFDMEFIIDFGNLAISLESPDTMPVVEQRSRQQQRERMLRTQRELRRDYYPILYDRNPQTFNGGFLDYNFTGNYSQTSSNFIYSTNIGTELLSGDLQGTIFGSMSETATALRSSGLRWRYGIRENEWISTVIVGQTNSLGLVPVAYTGIRVTNEPIEPRFMFGEIPFTGNVSPDSEVELYRNNTLVDFTRADESGFYRFNVPLTYGTSNYSIRTFSPTGGSTEREARLQIPFNFLPPGEFTYNFNAGRLDNPIAGSTERGYMANLGGNVGLTERITALGGVEYFEDFHDGLPTFRGGVSSRILTNYLVSIEAANDAFVRASGNVIYPSNASVSIDYTNFLVQGGIYNPSRNRSTLRTNIFTPFEIGSFPLFLRWSFTNDQRELGSINRYSIDLNTRIARANIRVGYRDSQTGSFSFRTTPVARVSSSATYNFSRSRDLPVFIRGVFLRGQTNFIPTTSRFEDVEIQVSRNVMDRGRFQLAGGRNFIGGFNQVRFTLTFDFNAVRSNTTIRSTRNTTTASQSVRGSIGYDSNNNQTLFSNRQQVGRSAVAVQLFVDNNNSGTFDEGDELIPDNAIRIDRAGGSRFSKDGISYVSQLQPYRQYNLTINKSAINNPLLVPQIEQFSIITDPNQYKRIQIPFYMSGIVDGMVNRVTRDGTSTGLGGLRLYLQQVNVPEGSSPFSQEFRTFSDGSFYAYEIPPGDYTLEVDPSQVNFLNVVPDPEKLEFTVRALAEGDFVEGLTINLMPDGFEPVPEKPLPVITASILYGDRFTFSDARSEQCRYSVQLGSFDQFSNAFDYADISETIIGEELEIIFNSRNNLYSVRTTGTYNYQIVQNQIRRIKEEVSQTVAVINQCGESVAAAQSDNFHIQLGSFSNQTNADVLIQETTTILGSKVFIHEQRDSGIFSVFAGPFATRNQMIDALQELTILRDIEDFLTRRSEELLVEDIEYEYTLSLGTFSTPDSAILFLNEQEEELDTRLDIIRLDSLNYQVITEDRTRDWDSLIELSEAISQLSGLAAPVAQLFPVVTPPLPPAPPATDTDVQEIEEEISARESLIELSNAIARLNALAPPMSQLFPVLPAAPVLPTGDDPIADQITDEEIPEKEEVKDEEEVTEVTDVPPPVPTRDFTEKTLASCTFPIQVGSYGGHILAQSMADEIAGKLGTEIRLYYNELSDMYALRSQSYESLQESLEKLIEFKQAEPLNEYAIVGQCTNKPGYREHKPIQFLVPLIRYSHLRQANLYADIAKDNHGFETIVRPDPNGEIFNVYAGPYYRYKSAIEMRDNIQRSGLITNPVLIIDPESRNRFRANFQIYFGPYDEVSAEDYMSQTGRTVTIKIDDTETKHLFDDTVYGSWTQFLQELRRIAELSGFDISESFILD